MKSKPTLTTNTIIAALLATSCLVHAEPAENTATPGPVVVQEIKAPPPQTGGDCTIALPEDKSASKDTASAPIDAGMVVERLSDAQRAQLPQLKPAAGLIIRGVIVKSAAANAGLKAGDILLTWNGDSLVHPEQLRLLAQSAKAGDKIPLTFLRQGTKQETQLTVSAPPQASPNATASPTAPMAK